MPVTIRPARLGDEAAILSIIGPVIRAGDTYALDPAMTDAAALGFWFGGDHVPFVAEEDGVTLGTYYLRANQGGGGGHVANCGYITAAQATGRGIARQMCQHSLEEARARGYRAMQFNFVVTTNTGAIRLWQSCGFAIVGRLPRAFRHPKAGFVDALVLFRDL